MLGRRRVTAPSNEAVAVVPVFTADPHGAALFHGAVSGGLGGGRAVIDSRVSQAWHGPTQSPQFFAGARGIGGGRAVVSPTSTLDQERGMAPDSVEAIFASRMAAGRFS
jgi:hypothetical protein